ncbi:MAG TPA: EamA family transporter [Actinomycetota bacterium]|nr:EamA family transporter [Actinomycetota bacterium]
MAGESRVGAAGARTQVPLVWAALAVVYIVWGSTYLAIRVTIETIPPMISASLRFLIAGSILYAFAIRRGDRADRPGFAQWRSSAIVGALLFLGGNGGVVWAEQRIPSGIAALLVATVPLWMALIGYVALRERLSAIAVAGLLVGFAGTALLIRPSGEGAVDTLGALVVVFASLSWAIGSLYSRRAPLPKRPLVSASMQMICGGVALGIAGIVGGELGRFEPASFSRSSILAFFYLIFFGAIAAFSCYAWLLRVAPTSLVSTYAYVNPVVAVALGWAIVDERVEPLTFVAGAIIVAAVAMIVTGRRIEEPGELAAGVPPVDELDPDAPGPPPGMSPSRPR